MKNPIKIPITPFKTPKTLQKLPKPLKSPEKDNFLDRNSHFNDINQILTLRNELHTSMDNFNDFQKEIEKRYKRSVMNKIYTFPRQPPDFSDTSSCDSLKSIEIYDLSTQNYEKINISPHPLKDLSNSPNQLLFDREIAKLNKELAYYKNHQNRGLSQEKELIKPLEQLKMKENIPCEENRKGRLPNYMKLLNFLEENNDFEIKKSILEHRTPSNSRSCNRSRAMQKTPCSFDRKIAVTFENCCDIKEKPLEESGFRSVSKGKGGREGSRSQSKSKRGGLDGRVLSPISYTYMNKFDILKGLLFRVILFRVFSVGFFKN